MMASTNQSPQYQKAESNYLRAATDEERLIWLQEMIKECPKHKSAEKMLAQLKIRLKKLKQKLEKSKKSGKGHKGIKKHDLQAVLIGFTNSGKSSILKTLTNAHPEISENQFTTQQPLQGMMNYQGTQVQIIDMPSLGSENFETSIVHTTDLLLITISNLEELGKIKKQLPNTNAKQLIIFNKSDLLDNQEKRKISETLKSKKYNFILISTKTQGAIEQLKEKIIENFEICRIYLKEPGKEPTDKPMIVKPNSTVLEVANKISHQLAKTIKQVRIWGPSSKFPNQKVGLNHIVKDKDIIEFKTK